MNTSRPMRSRRVPRPWVVPPALLVLDEPFEGFQVLDEVRSEVGVLLWQSLRDVDLWASTDTLQRAELFTPHAHEQRLERIAAEAAADPAARGLLEGLARVLDAGLPPRGADISEVCEAASRWASDQGWTRTALAFAQRSALAAPEVAGPAYLVGLVSRRAADYRRAETWFRRALALARRNRDWKFYGLAHLGLANVHMQRGDAPNARARLLRALRAARRYGVWSVRPFALHDLFCIAATGGDPEQAQSYARSAFRSYGRRHPRLPVLAHDVACFWMIQGEHRLALPTFEAVLPYIDRVPERMLALSNVARAAGGLADEGTFERAAHEVWALVDQRPEMERVPEALINVAHGAVQLDRWPAVERAASLALKTAARRRESQQRAAAEELLNKVRHARRLRRYYAESAPNPDPPPPLLPLTDDGAELSARERFAVELVEALGDPRAGTVT